MGRKAIPTSSIILCYAQTVWEQLPREDNTFFVADDHLHRLPRVMVLSKDGKQRTINLRCEGANILIDHNPRTILSGETFEQEQHPFRISKN